MSIHTLPYRCEGFEEAIKITMEKFISTHARAPVVLDIGTGTGLLVNASALTTITNHLN
jgi:methylase of polypeptide subunit release factors